MKTLILNLKTMRKIRLFMIPVLFVALFTACSDNDDPAPVNPEELITNVNVIFTNAADATDIVTLSAVSADGIVAPTLVVSGPFTSGAVYNATVTITDNINNENILEEIVEEKDEHFFVYDQSGVAFTMMRAATDEVRTDGESLGLNTTWTAGPAASGTITVLLIHEPTTVSDDGGFGSASGGEFDINNSWSVTIQ
jgi:hypothetical protein